MASLEYIQFTSRWAAGFLIALTLECGLLATLLFRHRVIFCPWYFSFPVGGNTDIVISSGVILFFAILVILGADLGMAWRFAKFAS